jgi:hypothetical protein
MRVWKPSAANPRCTLSFMRIIADRRFPYAVFYAYAESIVTIYAVFHTSRDPEKWRAIAFPNAELYEPLSSGCTDLCFWTRIIVGACVRRIGRLTAKCRLTLNGTTRE